MRKGQKRQRGKQARLTFSWRGNVEDDMVYTGTGLCGLCIASRLHELQHGNEGIRRQAEPAAERATRNDVANLRQSANGPRLATPARRKLKILIFPQPERRACMVKTTRVSWVRHRQDPFPNGLLTSRRTPTLFHFHLRRRSRIPCTDGT